MRKRAVIIILLVALSYVLGLVSAFYFPIRAVHLDGLLVRLLGGKIRPFVAARTFEEKVWYVTDRKPGPSADGKATYLGEYAGEVSHGLVKVEVPKDRQLGSPLGSNAIKSVEPISPEQFVKSLQDQSTKPVVIWIHGYKTPFNTSTASCAQIAHDLEMDANFISFD